MLLGTINPINEWAIPIKIHPHGGGNFGLPPRNLIISLPEPIKK